MDQARIDEVLTRTLDDGRVSRSERRALRQVLAETADGEHELDLIRGRAFHLAHSRLRRGAAKKLIEWLEDVIKVIDGTRSHATEQICEAWFSPGPDCVERLVRLIAASRRTLDICVFTITDNRVSRALLGAHQRSVRLRIISDNDKVSDLGSDIESLAEAGVPVVVDHSSAHMHHKFAVIDRRIVVSGSYNWTRSAADENYENLIVSDNPRLVKRFIDEFDRLWQSFRRGHRD